MSFNPRPRVRGDRIVTTRAFRRRTSFNPRPRVRGDVSRADVRAAAIRGFNPRPRVRGDLNIIAGLWVSVTVRMGTTFSVQRDHLGGCGAIRFENAQGATYLDGVPRGLWLWGRTDRQAEAQAESQRACLGSHSGAAPQRDVRLDEAQSYQIYI